MAVTTAAHGSKVLAHTHHGPRKLDATARQFQVVFQGRHTYESYHCTARRA